MENVLGTCFHKISGKIAFPEDKYNKERIVREIFEKYRVGYGIWIDQAGEAELLVPWGYQAFHAGSSRWKGRNYCNKFLIGIGLISDGIEFSEKMVETCAKVHLHLVGKYKFPVDNVTTHEYIRHLWNKTYPDSKADNRYGDPGKFPWDKFNELIQPSHDLNGG